MNGKTPLEDLRRNALKDYNEASKEACLFNNTIPKAINFYFDQQIKNKEEEKFNALKFISKLFQWAFVCFFCLLALGLLEIEIALGLITGSILFKISS